MHTQRLAVAPLSANRAQLGIAVSRQNVGRLALPRPARKTKQTHVLSLCAKVVRGEVIQVTRAVVNRKGYWKPIQVKGHCEIASWCVKQLDRPVVLALQLFLVLH